MACEGEKLQVDTLQIFLDAAQDVLKDADDEYMKAVSETTKQCGAPFEKETKECEEASIDEIILEILRQKYVDLVKLLHSMRDEAIDRNIECLHKLKTG